MFLPNVPRYFKPFCPLGKLPPVNLGGSLPQGVNGDILLLGCGDVRSIMFTTYCERDFPRRKLDITCCDIEPAVLARNVLLFTLLIDGVSADIAWDVYFHLRISEASKKLVKDQAQKMVLLSGNIDQWSEGHYGSVLKFCDKASLQQVRQIWSRYASHLKSEARFEKDLQYARDLSTRTLDTSDWEVDTTSYTRSTAPTLHSKKEDIVLALAHYREHGNFSSPPETWANPLFSEPLSPNTYIYSGTDPISGFHLATAYASLIPTSPLRPSIDGKAPKVVNAAKAQFREWVAAFQGIRQHRLALRFAVSDALSFSHALQIISTSGSTSTNLFRQQFDMMPVDFDPAAYGTVNLAPTLFDVIDDSNLADHLGALNILVAAAPLLKPSASSTLLTGTFQMTKKTLKEQFDNMLHGHVPTVSLLLGLTPVNLWTNATSVSFVGEATASYIAVGGDKPKLHSRVAWKLNSTFFPRPDSSTVLKVEPQALAKAVFQLFTRMFAGEDFESFPDPGSENLIEQMKTNTDPVFHRGSFAATIKRIRANTSTDWTSFWEHLFRMINQGKHQYDSWSGVSYHWDLDVQLHLQGLYSSKWLKENITPNPGMGGFNAWGNIPEVVCVTVVVPKEDVDEFYNADLPRVVAPTLEGFLIPNGFSGSQNFADTHVAFGEVKTSGSRETEDFSIAVSQDPLGWQGKSPLVASFYVPSRALQAGPNSMKDKKDTKVGIRLQRTRTSTFGFEFVPLSTTLYMTVVSDKSNVFITKYGPGMSGYPFAGGEAVPVAENSTTPAGASVATQITANLEDDKIKSLCGHVDFSSSQQGKSLLAERVSIELRQSSPSSIDIVFGKGTLICPVSFPSPVDKGLAKVRIARTSGYVEIIAPLADPLTSKALTRFMYPATLGEDSVPISLNIPHVNLDSLPILDVASSQLSARERQRWVNDGPISARMNFKRSLENMILVALGVPSDPKLPWEPRYSDFAFKHSGLESPIVVYIHAIRLNAPDATVVADAAVFQATKQVFEQARASDAATQKSALPVFAERCRTWTHGPKCEYKKPKATIPLSTKLGEQHMCSCGKGKFPEGYLDGAAWGESASKHAVRVAISLSFSVPFVEDTMDIESHDKCHFCKATKGKNGGGLGMCPRCRNVVYCSEDCRRKDWKDHLKDCKPHDAAAK
ncbi:hypothetical protein F4677DRAFT_453686 [Hypoxylon crocopeplum]|nr:hypothetical protein F4677DRAFT_453686 [Hypoxylon crocopeplum]